MQERIKRRGKLKRFIAAVMIFCMIFSGNMMTVFADAGITGIDNVVQSEKETVSSNARASARQASGEGTGNITEFAGGTGTAADPFLIKNTKHFLNMGTYLLSGTAYNFKQIADLDFKGCDFGKYTAVNTYGGEKVFGGFTNGSNISTSGNYDGGGYSWSYLRVGYCVGNPKRNSGVFGGEFSGLLSNLLISSSAKVDTNSTVNSTGFICSSFMKGTIDGVEFLDYTLIDSTTSGAYIGVVCGYLRGDCVLSNLKFENIDTSQSGGGDSLICRMLYSWSGSVFNVVVVDCRGGKDIPLIDENRSSSVSVSRVFCETGGAYSVSKGVCDVVTPVSLSDLLNETFVLSQLDPVRWSHMSGFYPLLGCDALRTGAPLLTVDFLSVEVGFVGRSKTLKCLVSANEVPGSMSYQWFKDGFQLDGETGDSLNLNNLSVADSGKYFCKVSNGLAMAACPPSDIHVWEGLGTIENPCLVWSADDLQWVGAGMDLNYRLMRNIDLAGVVGKQNIVSGVYTSTFSGVFDGGGFGIQNMVIAGALQQPDIGFFSGLAGTLKNVSFANASITSANLCAGVVAGRMFSGGVVSDVSVQGSVSGTSVDASTGGITLRTDNKLGLVIGEADADSWIQNVAAQGDVASGSTYPDFQWVGGLTGMGGRIKNSYFAGSLTGSGTTKKGSFGVGSLVTQESCFFDSTLLSGFSSSASNGTGLSTKDMKSESTANQLGGAFFFLNSSSYPQLVFLSSSYPSSVSTTLDNKILHVKQGDKFRFESKFLRNPMDSGWQWFLNGEPVPDATSNVLEGTWDDSWKGVLTCSFSANIGGRDWVYNVPFNNTIYVWAGGNGSAVNPFLVGNESQLAQVDEVPTMNFKQTADIDLGSMPEWVPIGTGSGAVKVFSGVYDGDGYSIRNLTIKKIALGYAGLFGSVSGTVKNLGIVNGTISTLEGNDGTGNYSGAVAGKVTGTIEKCFNQGCFVSNASSASSVTKYVGGIVGFAGSGAKINACYDWARANSADGTRGNVGGIAGYSDNDTTFQNCYMAGSLTGGKLRTPISGRGADTGITNCYYLDSIANINASYGKGTAKTDAVMKSEEFVDTLGKDASTGKNLYVHDSSPSGGYPFLAFPNARIILKDTYPEDLTVEEGYGSEAVFQAEIAAHSISGIYTYQWYKEGVSKPLQEEVSKEKINTFKIKNQTDGGNGVWAEDMGKYFCVISMGAGKVSTRKATLTTTVASGAPKYDAMRAGAAIQSGDWGQKKIDITIKNTKRNDADTETPAISYKTGSHDAEWKPYTGQFSISAEGRTNIYAKAEYSDGSVYYAGFQACIDTTKPVIGTIGNDMSGTEKANSRNVQVSDLSDGAGSGINGCYIKQSSSVPSSPDGTETEGWTALEASDTKFNREVTKNGTYYVWVRDNAGNISDASMTTLDHIVPVIKGVDLSYMEDNMTDKTLINYLRITPSGAASRSAAPTVTCYKDKDKKQELGESETAYESITYSLASGADLVTLGGAANEKGKLTSKTQTGTVAVTVKVVNFDKTVAEQTTDVLIRDDEAVITEHPQSVIMNASSITSTVNFSIKAEIGTNNKFYWFHSKDKNDTVGEQYGIGVTSDSKSSTLKLTNITKEYDGTYIWCKVVNVNNPAAVSNRVKISINSRPSVTGITPAPGANEPEGKLTVMEGEEASMSVTATTVSGDIFYQWQCQNGSGAWVNVADGIKKEITKTDKDGTEIKEAVEDEERSGHAATYIISDVKIEQDQSLYRCLVGNDTYPVTSALASQTSGSIRLTVTSATMQPPLKPIMTLLTDSENKSFESGKWNDEKIRFTMTPDGTVSGDTMLQYQIVTLQTGDDITDAVKRLWGDVDDSKAGLRAWTTVTAGEPQTVTQTTGTQVMVFGRAINKWVYENEPPEGGMSGVTSGKILMAQGAPSEIYGTFESWYDGTAATGTIEFGTAEQLYTSFIQKIQFNLFYKDALAVKVAGKDDESGISKIYYTWFNGKRQQEITTNDLAKLEEHTGSPVSERWNIYNDGGFSVNAADEGAKVIYAKIINNAGTVTYISSDGFIMDSTAPAIAETKIDDYKQADGKTPVSFVTDQGGRKWTAEASMKLQVTISDEKANVDESGVDMWRSGYSATELSADELKAMKAKDADWSALGEETSWRAYSSTASDNQISVSENGFVYIQASDKSGNISDIKKAAVTQFDHTAPTFTITASNMTDTVEQWTNKDVTLSVNDASDGNGSGLAGAAYWFTGFIADAYGTASSKSYGENGTYTVMVKDFVGNTAEKTCTIGKIDKTVPEIANDPTFTDATYNNEWLSGEAKNVTLNATGISDKGDTIDKGQAGKEEQTPADIEGVYVQTAATGTETTQALTPGADGSSSIVLENPGETKTYWLRAKDNAGNWSAAKAFTIKVDKTAPLIENITVSSDQTDNSSHVSFTAGDYQDIEKQEAGSGVEKVYYAKKADVDENTLLTDRSKYTEITGTNGNYTFKAPENVDYVVRAVDNVGNKTSIIDAYKRRSEVAVSVPTQMMFAVIPNAAEGFVSPDYTFTNLSKTDEVEVSVEKAAGKENSELILGESNAKLAEDTLRLYAEKAEGSEGFTSLSKALIFETRGDKEGCKTSFGKLAAEKSGKVKLKADTFGYNAAEKAFQKRGSWTLLLKLKAGTTI